MIGLFILAINMSIAASIVAIAVMLVRLPLKKTPKIFSYALWAVVFLRLICPFSIESSTSLMPINVETIPQTITTATTPRIDSGISAVDGTINRFVENALPQDTYVDSINPIQTAFSIGAVVWLVGMMILMVYTIASYILMKRTVYDATLREGNVYETDKISTAFILGLIHPKIYIPTIVGGEQLDYILMHEQVHIRRRDYLVKPLAFLILAIHWFNPIVWISYYFMSKDMEMSCDEAVLLKYNEDIRQEYSATLVDLYTRKSGLLSPLAFGEGNFRNMKERLKNVLKFKRTPRLVIILCSFLLVMFLAAFTTNPPKSLTVENPVNNQPSSAGEAVNQTDMGTNPFSPVRSISVPTTGYNQITRSLDGSSIENIKIYAELCTLQIEPASGSQIEVIMAYPEITSPNYENRFNLRLEQQNNRTAIISTDYDFQYGFDPIDGYDINSYPDDAYLIIKLPNKQYTSVDLQASVLGNNILEYNIPSSSLAIDINVCPDMVLKLGRVYDDLDVRLYSGTLDLQLNELSKNTTINLSNCMFALTLPSDPQNIDFSITIDGFTAYALPSTWSPVINDNTASYRAGNGTKKINIKTQYTDFEMRAGSVPSQRGVTKPETSAGSSSDLDVPSSNTVTSYSSFYDSSFAKNFGNQIIGSGNFFGAYRIDVRDDQGYDHQAMVFICNGTDSYKAMFNEALNGLYAAYPSRGQIASYLDLVYDNSIRNFGNSNYFATEQFILTDANGVSINAYLVAVSGSENYEEPYDTFFEAVIDYYKG